ncbi:ABC transporter ATP-binding protein [Bosea sp. BK604]|uniref:ABC transporter ATP-binding protein n=1 Tax=Bosea sp. BK604 TaxID=2512180 RepID=UPI0010D5C1E4|nr:ABC transporter ATP-binding protein [Bosea sp. BK604]TCR70440.1 NitT/TauT family transport system ATP-binding protein [Bosea sp. BK604]
MNKMTPAGQIVSSQTAAISIQNVRQQYPGRHSSAAVLALDDISLDIPRGEFVCLLGPSGCGKSTLLNIVGGLIKPTAGKVQVSGRTIDGPSPRDIAFIFQESTLLPWYTIRENFHVSFKFSRIARSEWQSRTEEALAAVGMSRFIDHYPEQLSVGMRQRVNLARGIALGTDIILMDEPFAALDEQTRMVLGEDLSELLAKTGKTIVFVTHSLAEAVFLSDRVYVMAARPGRLKTIVEIDEPHPRSPDFMLTTRFGDLRNQLYGLLRDEVREGLQIERKSSAAAGRT